MTVTYTAEVATCRGFGCFLKLLLRWRGSIYKLVWLDLSAFLLCYYILNIVYRIVLTPEQKRLFESVVQYCAAYSNLIPLSFVLGFYVSIVMTRWWNQYTSIPWPDSIAVFVSANVHGQDERGRVMRRTIMRYVCLCITMVLTNISPRVKKRFPTLGHLVEAGLLVENEKNIIDVLNANFPRHSKHWLPIVWAASIVTRARKEGRIRDDFAVKTVIDELNKFRGQCGLLISFDTISVPLVYTQVVTLAVYSYFLTSIMGQQWTDNKEVAPGLLNIIDLYFPLFTTLQFFFYMGWLKVAESLINPFGEDDDDFEVSWMVDRNLQVSYMIVDEMHHEHPELIKDQYWDEIFPNELPYTIGSERFREVPPQPSTAKIEVPAKAAMTSNLSSVKVDDMVGKTGQNLVTTNYKFPEIGEEVMGQVDQNVATDNNTSNVKTTPASTKQELLSGAGKADDNASGIHFTVGSHKADRHISGASTPSMASVSGTMSRVNTVASALKRLLSRDDGNKGVSTPDVTFNTRLPGSASTNSLAPTSKAPAAQGSMRITDQVIEEVDEQMTITSRAGENINRPTVYDIFDHTGPIATSAPVDVPKSGRPAYIRTQSAADDINRQPFIFPAGVVDKLSSSAPTKDQGHMPPAEEKAPTLLDKDGQKPASVESVHIFPMEDVDNKQPKTEPPPEEAADDFEKLRQAREKERIERQKQKIARSISTQPPLANVEGAAAPPADQQGQAPSQQPDPTAAGGAGDRSSVIGYASNRSSYNDPNL
ncbi:bestrophin-2 isoform X2 [Hermetia illucens]|uniref:bestrophin-2 isoform X2 n=1 Tax=Hermetia illucens TaxID=343691 RepID=UPI0018CC19ED|nr:bestrophin-2 isoform X2 [Hermetia illucens]